MSERFTILDLKNGDGEVTHTVICDNGKSITNKDAVAILNAYSLIYGWIITSPT